MAARAFGAALALLATIAVCSARVYHTNDVVPSLRKSQYRGYRTAWSEMLHHEAPRFAQDRTVSLLLKSASEMQLASEDEFKVMLAFDDESFLTQVRARLLLARSLP
jgi:hypothetical protein